MDVFALLARVSGHQPLWLMNQLLLGEGASLS